MKTRLYLFRHGETDWNVEERFQGHLDIPLNAKGRKQAREMVKVLREGAIEAILSSDLSRAVETAEIVAWELGVPVFQDAGLREANLGKAQGLTRSEIESQFGKDLVELWKSPKLTDADVCYPSSETGSQVYQRATETIRGFIHRNSYNRIGIATHGGVIRRIMQRLLPPDSPPVPIPNGITYQIVYYKDSSIFTLS